MNYRAIIMFLVFFSASAFCADVKVPEPTIAPDASWQVVFASFEGKNLSPENDHLVKSIPLLLQSELESIEYHYFDEESRQEYRKALVSGALSGQYASFRQQEKARDELVFTVKDEEELKKKQTELDLAIEEIAYVIGMLKQYDYSGIEYPEKMKIQVRATEKNEVLFEAPKYSALQYALDKKTNLLIYGSVEEIQGYLVLEIKALDSVKAEHIAEYRKVISPEELSIYVEEAKISLARAILGTDWGTLSVTVIPEKTMLYLEGEFFGIGDTSVDYIPLGEKKLAARSEGYYETEKTITIQAKKATTVEMSLSKIDLKKTHVTSSPDGADVYIDSEWVGKTPIDIEKNKELKRVLLKMDGYDDYSFHIGDTAGPSITIELVRHSIDFNARQSEARDNFYTSFGFCLISIALPIFLYGASEDSNSAATQVGQGSPLYADYVLASDIYNAAFWGSLAITGALVVTAVFNLVQYIIASDRPFG